jgi:hypothetical protein
MAMLSVIERHIAVIHHLTQRELDVHRKRRDGLLLEMIAFELVDLGLWANFLAGTVIALNGMRRQC